MPKFQIAFLVCQPSLSNVGLNHTGPLTCGFFLINRNSIKLSAGWICRCRVTKIEGTDYGARVSSDFWHRKGLWAPLVARTVKILPAVQETRVQFLIGKMPWRRAWKPTPVLLPGESPGQRGQAGYSPRGRKELDMTEWLRTPGTNSWHIPRKKCRCISI